VVFVVVMCVVCVLALACLSVARVLTYFSLNTFFIIDKLANLEVELATKTAKMEELSQNLDDALSAQDLAEELSEKNGKLEDVCTCTRHTYTPHTLHTIQHNGVVYSVV
jgi:cell division protein FtsL